jgi:hypothetical protein
MGAPYPPTRLTCERCSGHGDTKNYGTKAASTADYLDAARYRYIRDRASAAAVEGFLRTDNSAAMDWAVDQAMASPVTVQIERLANRFKKDTPATHTITPNGESLQEPISPNTNKTKEPHHE